MGAPPDSKSEDPGVAKRANDSESGDRMNVPPVDWDGLDRRRLIYQILFAAMVTFAIAEGPGFELLGWWVLFPVMLLLYVGFLYHLLKTVSLLRYQTRDVIATGIVMLLPVVNLLAFVLEDPRIGAMIARRELAGGLAEARQVIGNGESVTRARIGFVQRIRGSLLVGLTVFGISCAAAYSTYTGSAVRYTQTITVDDIARL